MSDRTPRLVGQIGGQLDQSEAAAVDQSLPDPLPAEPMGLFRQWFDEAHARRIQPNPNAFTLATIDADGTPSARVVLCKGIDAGAGSIVFHTNYNGRKGRALAANPRAGVCFHWDVLDQQVRIEGLAVRTTAAESDAYFLTRPWVRRVGAWTSQQSEPVASRAALVAQLEATMRRFGIDPASPPPRDAKIDIPRPPHWGGVRIWAQRVELWVGSAGRLHDRAAWARELRPSGSAAGIDGAGFEAVGPWSATRLQP